MSNSETKDWRKSEVPLKGKHVIYAILIVGVIVGIVGYHLHTESEKKPEFNVYDLRLGYDSVDVYVQNIGNKDAHKVRIDAYAHGLEGSCTFNGEIEVLNIGQIEKLVLYSRFGKVPLHQIFGYPFNEFKVEVRCKEGVTQEFYFKR